MLPPKNSFDSVVQKLAFGEGPLMADCVEKLQNRGASKIPQMIHVGDSSCRKVRRIDTSVGSRFFRI
jgi:hypothetical protein